MNGPWPSFTTADLGPNDDEELVRRWKVYNSEMQLIIAAGGVHQDADGWWYDDATGEIIGPDPEIEMPMMEGDPVPKSMTFADALPDLAGSVAADTRKVPRRA